MSYPLLRRGDQGPDVIRLQSLLNRVGAMLSPDGDFGAGTECGIKYAQDVAGQPQTGKAETALWQWLDNKPEPFPKLDTNGVAFIALEETGGLAYYEAHTIWPHWPGEASGITIGVGYDLRFQTATDLQNTWGAQLPAKTLTELSKDLGKRGSKKRAAELADLQIKVPFKAAWSVFIAKTLPRYYADTLSIYPSLDKLSPLCRSVLVSLVFNRGNALNGESRREMREIQALLDQAAQPGLDKTKRLAILAGVEDQLVSMKRLWNSGSGLIKRRQAEANLWRKGLSTT